MPGKGIGDLPMPADRFRPDRMQPSTKPRLLTSFPRSGFETAEQAAAEDALRSRKLKAAIGLSGEEKAAALKLAECLDMPDTPTTLASSRYVHDHRTPVAGNMAMLCDQFPDARPFTVIPRGWQFPHDQLECAHPGKLMKTIGADLYRKGAAKADGFLIAFAHGEYDPGTKLYQLHGHGLAAGGMLMILDQLRALPKYSGGKRGRGEQANSVQRLRIERSEIDNLPLTMAYCLQSFWPSRWSGEVGNGAMVRERRKGRIPDPHHSRVLLWLNRWRLNDLCLLLHVRVTNGGFSVKGTE
jgi:hypothetical protein